MGIQINTITLKGTIINILSLTTQKTQIIPTIKKHTGEERAIPLTLNKEVDQEAIMTQQDNFEANMLNVYTNDNINYNNYILYKIIIV